MGRSTREAWTGMSSFKLRDPNFSHAVFFWGGEQHLGHQKKNAGDSVLHNTQEFMRMCVVGRQSVLPDSGRPVCSSGQQSVLPDSGRRVCSSGQQSVLPDSSRPVSSSGQQSVLPDSSRLMCSSGQQVAQGDSGCTSRRAGLSSLCASGQQKEGGFETSGCSLRVCVRCPKSHLLRLLMILGCQLTSAR